MASESVEPLLDPVADSGYCVGLGGPDVAVVELGLQGGPERLGGGVVPADPGPSHRPQQTEIATQVGDLSRRVLTSPVGVEDHLCGELATEHERHGQRPIDPLKQ